MTSSGNPLQESLDNQGNVNGVSLEEINKQEARAEQIARESGGLEPGETFHKPDGNKTKTQDAQESKLKKDDEKIVDEKNENEDGTSAEENLDTEYTVLINGEKIILTTDKFGTSLVDKLEGHGLHVQQNGDIAIISGKGGKGKACGGRLLINTKNGQITKSGPIVQDVTADSKSSTEDDGSIDSKDAGNSQVAYSGSFSGDYVVEIQGEQYVKARDIVLDATDTLTLRGTKIIVQADEWVEEKGLEKSKVDNVEEEITSQRTSEVKEDTAKQYDTRATQNVVGSGHINQRVKGDYQLLVDGIANIQVMANQVTAPLVQRNGNLGLMIGVNSSKGQAYGIRLSAASFLDFAAGSGNISLSTARGIHLDTQVMETDQGIDGADTTAAGIGEIKFDAAKGFNVKSWKEDINIEAKIGDIGIKSTKGNVKVDAPAGDFDVYALKIYLN